MPSFNEEAVKVLKQQMVKEQMEDEHDVCNIIPDYPKELKELEEKLAHKTEEVKRLEYFKEGITKERNKLRDKVYQLQYEMGDIKVRNQVLEQEIKNKQEIISSKDMIIDSMQHISEIIREAKRARTTD